MLGSAAAAPPEARRVADVAYRAGAGDAQSLDLYLPEPMPQPAPPLFVYIHGGAWISGDKLQYAPIGRTFATQGIATAVINYRLSGEEGIRHPSHSEDAAAAVAFLRAQAGRYGYDPARVFVGGHSAGAHISALLALEPQYLKKVGETPAAFRGFIGIEGIYDIPLLYKRFPNYREDFLREAFGADEAGWQRASPQHLEPARGGRPFLLIHSPEDELVDLPQTTRFAEKLQKAGVPVTSFTSASGSHFGVIAQLLSPTSAVAQQLVRFIKSPAPAAGR